MCLREAYAENKKLKRGADEEFGFDDDIIELN